jgi:hypothetical protein
MNLKINKIFNSFYEKLVVKYITKNELTNAIKACSVLKILQLYIRKLIY